MKYLLITANGNHGATGTTSVSKVLLIVVLASIIAALIGWGLVSLIERIQSDDIPKNKEH